MPSKSKRQWKFMKLIEKGKIKKEGLSPEKAKEYTSVSPKSLPEKVKKKK